MTIVLAATWNPRGELTRFERLLPQLEQAYQGIVISFPPDADAAVLHHFTQGSFSTKTNLVITVTHDWAAGRYMALSNGLQFPAAHFQYADMDRLLRWVELYPQDWQAAIPAIQNSDCLIFGRTPAAYATHPKNIVQTEALSNRVVSYFLGQPVDVSAGTKGFNRRAVEFLVAHARPACAFGADAEWPILLKRGGFQVDYLEIDSLDWETADRYRAQAADTSHQHSAAQASDADPQNWEYRILVAQEIIRSAIEAASREL